MNIDQRLKELKIQIPELAKPVGSYVPAVKTGHLVYTAGQLPLVDGRVIFPGRVGKDVTLENAQRAAKASLVNCLAAVKWALGSLDRVKKFVRLNAHVCSAIDYNDQAKVMNAASDLLVEIFGDEIGSHTRVTVGSLELPLKAVIEIDMIAEFK